MIRRLLPLCTLLLCAQATVAEDIAQPMSKGEAVYRLAGCENCHTDRAHDGPRLAGGRRIATPLGVFYTPNITPDPDTGIGGWSRSDFIRALREGVSPEGENYYPSFPYTSYTRLSDRDLDALWDYLRVQPAVQQANKPHELPWYLDFRPLVSVWKWLYFTPGPYQPDPQKDVPWNRGAYLVQGAGHCGECHTPRDSLGGCVQSTALAGTMDGPEGAVVPNITPDHDTGIGSWSEEDVSQYLAKGMRPDGDFAGDLMAEVIDNGLQYLPEDDLRSIAVYLATRPAVPNAVRKVAKKEKSGNSEF